jgi:hypothetical protein
VDALPKNRIGKLHRRALRESLAAAEASQGLRAGCSLRATLEHAQLAALRKREARAAIGPLPRDGLQTLARSFKKGTTMSVRRSIILLTLTAVALTVTGPLAAAAQQTGPASAPAVFDAADRAAILVVHGVGAQIYECKVDETAATTSS